MSETPAGPGWWQASDGRWYPPESHPSAQPPPAMPPTMPPARPPAMPTMPAPGAGGVPPQGPPPAYPPAYPPVHPPAYPPAPPPRKKRGILVAFLVLLFAAMLGAAGALVVVLTTDDDKDDEPTGDPVTLESVSSPGANPFVTGSAVASPALSAAALDAAEAVSGGLDVDDATGGRVASGTEPGLYGGTMDEQSCDPFALADFLESAPDKAAAWAEVLGIAVADIRPYIEGLTPVLLTADTWVTNHGFENGAATSFQSVLQAGSAVLIDEHGVPRVRCFCGNPLTQPETDDYTLRATEGDSWEDYEPEDVRRVQGGDAVLETVTLIDAETGATFDRGLGPGQTGEVQATLRWTGTADMDLHLIDANGDEIYFGARTSSSGGELDLDKIPGCDSGDTGPHTENIFWETEAPPGDYQVWVYDYSSCEETTDFDLQVIVGGTTVVSEKSTISQSQTESTRYEFAVY